MAANSNKPNGATDTEKACNSPESPKRPLWKRLFRLLWKVYAVLAAIYLTVVLVISFTPAGLALLRWMGNTPNVEELNKAEAIVVLGGDPYRAIDAAALYRHGLAKRIILSGDSPRMRYALQASGIPAAAIESEDDALRTIDHPQTIQQFAGIDPKAKLILLSNGGHPMRVRAIFRQAGYTDFQVYSSELTWMKDRPYLGMIEGHRILYEAGAWLKQMVMDN